MSGPQKRPARACGGDTVPVPGGTISVDTAFALIDATASTVEDTECIPLAMAHGRVLPEITTASTMSSPFDNTAMDGCAMGRSPLTSPTGQQGVVLDALRYRPGRCEFCPARLIGLGAEGQPRISCPDTTNSAAVAPLAAAHGFAVLPADIPGVAKGSRVEFVPLNH